MAGIYSYIWDILETILIMGGISAAPILLTWYASTSDSSTDSNYNTRRKNVLIAGIILILLVSISLCSSVWHYNDNNRAYITDMVRNNGSYGKAFRNVTGNAINSLGNYVQVPTYESME